jgi:threonine/homoserine efflux transporter RhtA
VWIALDAAGIVLLVDPGGGSVNMAGVGFALATGACWMAYIYLSKRAGAAFPGGSGPVGCASAEGTRWLVIFDAAGWKAMLASQDATVDADGFVTRP